MGHVLLRLLTAVHMATMTAQSSMNGLCVILFFPQGDLLYRDLHVGIECRTVVTSYGEDAANLSCQVERPIG